MSDFVQLSENDMMVLYMHPAFLNMSVPVLVVNNEIMLCIVLCENKWVVTLVLRCRKWIATIYQVLVGLRHGYIVVPRCGDTSATAMTRRARAVDVLGIPKQASEVSHAVMLGIRVTYDEDWSTDIADIPGARVCPTMIFLTLS